MNGCPASPTRCCRKKTGPGDVSFTSAERHRKAGEKAISNALLPAISRARLAASLAITCRWRRRSRTSKKTGAMESPRGEKTSRRTEQHSMLVGVRQRNSSAFTVSASVAAVSPVAWSARERMKPSTAPSSNQPMTSVSRLIWASASVSCRQRAAPASLVFRLISTRTNASSYRSARRRSRINASLKSSSLTTGRRLSGPAAQGSTRPLRNRLDDSAMTTAADGCTDTAITVPNPNRSPIGPRVHARRLSDGQEAHT